MKILLNKLTDDFNKTSGDFCGVPSFLITPKNIAVKFTQENKIFRSSIWDVNGNLLSASFPKFTNFNENPENFPVPPNLQNCNIITKIDGSTLICDFVNNQFNMRTRGTFSYISQKNRADFDLIKNKYPLIIDWLKENHKFSIIFEIVTPNNIIVLKYKNEPDIYLTGCINKNNYSLLSQSTLDCISKEIKVVRPTYFHFNNLNELIENISSNTELEGCCLYSENDQTIHKIKSKHYLKLHAFKSQCTLENLLELYLEGGRFTHYNEFAAYLEQKFDYECFNMSRGFISEIMDAKKVVDSIVEGMVAFVNKLKGDQFLTSRKRQAEEIIKAYGTTNRASFVFRLLDGKPLDNEAYKKLFFQVLKK